MFALLLVCDADQIGKIRTRNLCSSTTISAPAMSSDVYVDKTVRMSFPK